MGTNKSKELKSLSNTIMTTKNLFWNAKALCRAIMIFGVFLLEWPTFANVVLDVRDIIPGQSEISQSKQTKILTEWGYHDLVEKINALFELKKLLHASAATANDKGTKRQRRMLFRKIHRLQQNVNLEAFETIKTVKDYWKTREVNVAPVPVQKYNDSDNFPTYEVQYALQDGNHHMSATHKILDLLDSIGFTTHTNISLEANQVIEHNREGVLDHTAATDLLARAIRAGGYLPRPDSHLREIAMQTSLTGQFPTQDLSEVMTGEIKKIHISFDSLKNSNLRMIISQTLDLLGISGKHLKSFAQFFLSDIAIALAQQGEINFMNLKTKDLAAPDPECDSHTDILSLLLNDACIDPTRVDTTRRIGVQLLKSHNFLIALKRFVDPGKSHIWGETLERLRTGNYSKKQRRRWQGLETLESDVKEILKVANDAEDKQWFFGRLGILHLTPAI